MLSLSKQFIEESYTIGMHTTLIFLNAAIVCLSFALRSKKDRFILNPFNSYWLGFVYFSVIQPLTGGELYSEKFGYNNVSFALFCFGLSGCAIVLSEHTKLPNSLINALPNVRSDRSGRILFVGLMMIGLGAFLHYSLIEAYGGWAQYFARSELRKFDLAISKYYAVGQDVLVFGVVVVLLYARAEKRLRLTIISLAAIAIIALWYTYVGSRSRIIVVSVAILGAFYASKLKNPPLINLSALAFLSVFLIGFIGAYRNEFSNFSFNLGGVSWREIVVDSFLFFVADSDGGVSVNEDFGMAAAALAHVPVDLGFNYGAMFSQIFIQWIPKDLWPGKIYPEGYAWHLFHQVAGTSTSVNGIGYMSGPAPTSVGKFWYSFGFPGVIIGSYASGLLLKTSWTFSLLQPPLTRALLMTLCFGFGFSEINNPVYWLTFWLPSAGAILFIVFGISKINLGSRIR